jgi:hypothetical protein
MGEVHRFDEEHASDVIELHRRVLDVGPLTRALDEAYRDWLSDVFLVNSGRQGGVHSLVYQDDRGKVAGFLGAVPRRLRGRRENVLAAVSSQFVVDPTSRAELAGVALLREFFSGPQDLSIADEANASSAKLWCALGGRMADLYCIHWIRPLRPFALAAGLALRRSFGGVIGDAIRAAVRTATTPVARWTDRLLPRIVPRAFDPPSQPLHAESVRLEEIGANTTTFASPGALAPRWDDENLARVLDRLTRRRDGAGLYPVLLRDRRARAVGA